MGSAVGREQPDWISVAVPSAVAVLCIAPAAGRKITMGSDCCAALDRCHKKASSDLFIPPVRLFQMGITAQESAKSASALLNRKALE